MPTARIANEINAGFGPKTKGKILAASITLFNAEGFDRVTTAQIAQAADVLEGTLWYHFKAKQTLVLAHLEALERRLEEQLSGMLSDIGPEIARHFLKTFQTLWDFRYLLRDPLQSLLEDPAFTTRLQRTYVVVEAKVQERLEAAADHGLLDLSNIDVRALAVSCMLTGRYWLDYTRIRYADNLDPDRDHWQGIIQMIALLRPHFTDKARRVFKGLDLRTLINPHIA